MSVMSPVEILLMAVALAMDACAVSLGAGTGGWAVGVRPTFRLSFHFGLFQFLMPVLGWLAGTTVARHVAAVDHWVAFALLAFVGGRMIHAAIGEDRPSQVADPSRGLTLVMLSLATSIDAFAVGLSLALVGVSIWLPSVVIGLITGGLSLVALKIGTKLGSVFGRRMEAVGGAILIAIGVRIVVEHLSR
jgi:putative Mn2+ efflux pump MntP